MTDKLRLKFWGVRGSYPTPGAGTVYYGGNTASVEVQAGDRTILLDAGTGIIPLGRELAPTRRAGELVLLLSHLHHDHTQGFPFFLPAYLPGTRLHIFGPDGTHDSLRNVLERNQSSETFPISLREMASAKEIQAVHETQIIVWDQDGVRVVDSGSALGDEAIVVRIHKSYAHPGGVFVYRITWRGRSVVYATDTEGYVGTDKRLVNFSKRADILIHDAQFTEEQYRGLLPGIPSTQGFGHSTVGMACDVAAAAETGQLVLFHHDPSYDDSQIKANQEFAQGRLEGTRAAYEGMEMVLQDEDRTPRSQAAHRGREVQYAANG